MMQKYVRINAKTIHLSAHKKTPQPSTKRSEGVGVRLATTFNEPRKMLVRCSSWWTRPGQKVKGDLSLGGKSLTRTLKKRLAKGSWQQGVSYTLLPAR